MVDVNLEKKDMSEIEDGRRILVVYIETCRVPVGHVKEYLEHKAKKIRERALMFDTLVIPTSSRIPTMVIEDVVDHLIFASVNVTDIPRDKCDSYVDDTRVKIENYFPGKLAVCVPAIGRRNDAVFKIF